MMRSRLSQFHAFGKGRPHMSHRILVVDDEVHIQQVLTLKLRNSGYVVITASDGEEGMNTAVSEKPDLIISDFQMPYMTGLEMCTALKQHEDTATTPVIMLTARGYALSDDDLAATNIKDVIGKPFSPRAILSQVQEILGVATGMESKAA